MCNRKYIFKGSIVHCYVSLPGCIYWTKATLTFQGAVASSSSGVALSIAALSRTKLQSCTCCTTTSNPSRLVFRMSKSWSEARLWYDWANQFMAFCMEMARHNSEGYQHSSTWPDRKSELSSSWKIEVPRSFKWKDSMVNSLSLFSCPKAHQNSKIKGFFKPVINLKWDIRYSRLVAVWLGRGSWIHCRPLDTFNGSSPKVASLWNSNICHCKNLQDVLQHPVVQNLANAVKILTICVVAFFWRCPPKPPLRVQKHCQAHCLTECPSVLSAMLCLHSALHEVC